MRFGGIIADMDGFRFRCYPTEDQAPILRQWIGCQRFIYNAKVGEDRYFRRFAKSALALTGTPIPIDQTYAQFKTDLTPFLADVPAVILRNGAVRWKQAYQRFFKGLGGRPTIKTRHGRQSVWLTRELFAFEPIEAAPGHYRLLIGNRKFPVGELAFTAHRAFEPPASLHISLDAGRWHVSFSNETATETPSATAIAERLQRLTIEQLQAATVGLDRGVATPVMTSDGQRLVASPVQQQRLAQKERRRKRWQRKLARRCKGGKNRAKARAQVARTYRYASDVRRDLAHKATRVLVDDPRYQVYALEALRVPAMTRRATPKPDPERPGHYLPNNAKAKSGLNRSILASGWGQFKTILHYKATRAGKLVVEVPPAYSSQECARCGHIHPDNRPSQARFVCQACGHHAHADHNAAQVIAARGARLVADGQVVEKPKKRCALKRTTVGPGEAEPAGLIPRTPVENALRRGRGHTPARRSMKQETPATSQRL